MLDRKFYYACKICSAARDRTWDILVNSEALYRLSYRGICISIYYYREQGKCTTRPALNQNPIIDLGARLGV
jgi:hypothetical protein